jgi:ADP-ribose pyrophosphatase
MTSLPKVLGSRTLRDAWPPITEDEIELANGMRRNWVRFHFGNSAAVLPLTTEGKVVLTHEYRHGLGRIAVALPGGTAEDGESVEDCARRELLEETGLEPGKLMHLYSGNSLTGYLTGTLHLFFAKDCKATGRAPDPEEVESLLYLSPTQALDRARRGEFESTVLALAILLADARGWLVG